MNRYLLPLVVNNRRAIVLPLETQTNQPAVYIAESDMYACNIPLLLIDKNKFIQTLVTQTKDVFMSQLNFQFQLEGSKLSITIGGEGAKSAAVEDDWRKASFKKSSSNNRNQNASQQFEWQSGVTLSVNELDNKIWLYAGFSDQACKEVIANNILQIEIAYLNQYIGQIQIAVSTPASMLAFGFDFGSESSQIRHKRYKKIGNESFETYEDPSLFQMLADYKQELEMPNAYYQSEKDTPFLKSIFFVEKELDSLGKNIEDEIFIPNPKNLATLKKTQEADANFFKAWMQIPNLKLSHKYGQDLQSFQLTVNKNVVKSKITLHQIKGQLYSTVLKDILEAYLCSQVHIGNVYDIRLHLLVPNIYDYQDLARTKYAIKQIIDNLNATILQNAIRCFELVTLSESDASYMGFFNTGKRIAMPNSYYIIIDCGKGTTDFSVVQTESQAINFKNVYRDGFAGAGNLLTYACFEAFCYYLIKVSKNKANAKQYLQNLFDNLQGGQKELFYNEVEKYKRNYNPSLTQLQIEQHLLIVKSGSIGFENLFDDANVAFETLLSLMQQIHQIFDWNNYISDAVDFINAQVTSGLSEIIATMNAKNIACGGVLLSGRGFLFELLKQKTVQAITALNIAQSLIHTPDTPKAYKSVCMQGVFKHNYIFNSDIMCMPVELQLNETVTQTATKKGNFLKSFLKGKVNLVDMMFKDDYTFNESTNSLDVQSHDLNSLRFVIGNAIYQVKNTTMPSKGKLSLQFDNNRFVLRSLDIDGKLLDTSALVLDTITTYNFIQNIFASLFPVVLQTEQMDFLSATYIDSQSFLPDF